MFMALIKIGVIKDRMTWWAQVEGWGRRVQAGG